jgi:hypothetical protein
METKYKSVLMSLAMIGLRSVFVFSCAAGGASPTTTQGAAYGSVADFCADNDNRERGALIRSIARRRP